MLTVIQKSGEPFFVSIVSCNHRTPEQAAAEIEELHRLSGLVNFAVSFSMQPQSLGGDPLKKAEWYGEKFRQLQACRKNPALKIGILIQQSMGHGGRWNPNFDRSLDWQRTTRNGVPGVKFCPLDPRFRKYIADGLCLIMAGKPDFLILDDDTRMTLLPGDRKVECFCPLHTDHFNRKYGTNYTPEELRDAVVNAPAHDPIQLKFMASGAETISGYIRLFRETADSISPGIPMLLCGCHVDAGRHGKWAADAAAPGQPPVLRIGNGSYLERSAHDIIFRNTDTASQKLYSSEAALLLDEADTCPHTLYSKSARTMHLHVVCALLNGLDGAKLWITDTFKPDPAITAPYAAIIKENMGLYRELHRTVGSWRREGAVNNLPLPENSPFPAFTEMTPCGRWVEGYLAVYGVPFRWGKPQEHGVHLIAGEAVDWFTDAEIEKMLAEPALIDAEAAKRLVDRGFGKPIGLESVEELTRTTEAEFIVKTGEPVRKSRGKYYLLKPLPETEVLTVLKARTAYSADGLEDAAPGTVQCGRIIVTAWTVQPNNRIDLQNDRRGLLLQLLERIGGLPARVVSDADAGCWYGSLEHGKLLAAANLAYDPWPECVFELKQIPDRIELLQGDGSWKTVPFSAEGKRITVPVRLECAQIAVFRISEKGCPE
ncbi:MAG: hypothetical protein E7055_08245 [Lentisphaerae bacterium]|nr:hypothetical protein [Lentisphaerota bacterium]